MCLIRQLHLNQHPSQWEYTLRYERDVNAQLEAIRALQNFPVLQTQAVLLHALENERFYYRVRARAAHCLTEVCNRLPDGLLGAIPPLIDVFQRLFCCKAAPSVPQMNNFSATSASLQMYFLMKVIRPFPRSNG